MIRLMPETTAEQENFRVEPVVGIPHMSTIKRDPVQPVPVGTYVAKIFRVSGYDPDCDGSLMARLEAVDSEGQITGWQVDSIGLYPETVVVLDGPGDLHVQAS
jgi:hypothetical protein